MEQETFSLQKESQLEGLLCSLPKELSDSLRKETDEIDSLDDAIAVVQSFIERRNVVKEKIFTSIQDIQDGGLQLEVRAITSNIEKIFGDTELAIGEGTVGKVYFIPEAPHLCVKYIYDPNMLERHGNTMRQEVQYLVDMHGFSAAQIRVPEVYFTHMSDSVTCFGMERIDGMSLDKIIEDPNNCKFLEEIRNQNMKDVIKNMQIFIKKMHEEMRMVHRDLATRNIMIDKKGNWYVIDFGKAKRIEIGDSSTEMSEKTDFPSAENSIRKLFNAIS